MRSAICILTFRRLPVLQTMLAGIQKHCSQYPLLISEDCGQRDDTSAFLQLGCRKTPRPEYMAVECIPEQTELTEEEKLLGVQPLPRYRSFLGDINLGVAGNSNRAIRWFMEETDADHLCLCNDDLHVLGDFPALYAKAHEELGVGLLTFTDFFEDPKYDASFQVATVRSRGWRLKLYPRAIGIMLSMTRQVVKDIGYFDSRFRMGQEHVDFTHRARFAGHISLDEAPQPNLDVYPETPVLKHQDAARSVTGETRAQLDREAEQIMNRVSAEYRTRHYYRPFSLIRPAFVGGFAGGGIPMENLEATHKLVTDLAPAP